MEEITDRNAFKEERGVRSGGWDIEGEIVEEPAGERREVGNRELEEEEAKVNNDIEEIQLGGASFTN